jgi:glycosyltransferase involved in cell wall biosynthesis
MATNPSANDAVAQSSQPFVSVIIPVFNDAVRLALCLRALDAQTYPPSRYEVIAVDNDSTAPVDGVVSQFRQARWTEERVKSSYAARNKGLALATGDVFAFTDSDCIPSADWIERGVAALENTPHCGLVAGRVALFYRDPDHPGAVELYDNLTSFPQEKYVAEGHYGVTANLFTSRAIMESVGQFDGMLQSGGDREWGRRVHGAGFALVYADDVCVAHPARYRFGDLMGKAMRVITGDYAIKRKQGWRHREFLRGTLKEFVPPVQRTLSIYSNPTIHGFWLKTQVVAVMYAERYVRAFQRTRLLLRDLRRRNG